MPETTPLVAQTTPVRPRWDRIICASVLFIMVAAVAVGLYFILTLLVFTSSSSPCSSCTSSSSSSSSSFSTFSFTSSPSVSHFPSPSSSASSSLSSFSSLSSPLSSSSSINPSNATATAIEQYLINRNTAFYASLQNMTALQVMALVGGTGTNGADGLDDDNLGGISSSSATSHQQAGAAYTLQIALYHGFPQFLTDAITSAQNDIITRIYQFNLWWTSTGGQDNNGGVKVRQELGTIAWEAWLLDQAGAYLVATPGASINTGASYAAGTWASDPPTTNTLSVQVLFEQLIYSYVEQCAYAPPCETAATYYWGTTGFNKQVSQGLAPAFMLGIYGDTTGASVFPNTFTGYMVMWDGMFLGQLGSFEPDNSPIYGNFNVWMTLQQALGMNRLSRGTSTDPHAFLSDSVDMPRVIERFYAETMPNGNAIDYNRAISNWLTSTRGSCSAGKVCYQFTTAENTAPYNLKMGYLLYGNTSYLYTARMIERYYVTTGTFSATIPDGVDLYPANLNAYNVVGITAPAPLTEVTGMRSSPGCGGSYDLCFACPQLETILMPKSMILRAGTGETSAYSMMSIGAAGGPHANTDQRMTLENIIANDVYVAARPNGPIQVNQCNCILILPSSVVFPVPSAIDANATTFYLQANLPNSTTNNYILQDATATQLSPTSAYGVLTYSQYMYAGYHATRQVLLQATGLTIVIDSISYDGTVPLASGLLGMVYGSANGGMTWRIWPGVTASGSNWMLQAPVFSIGTTGYMAATTNASTLFWISEGTGRSYGSVTEPLDDEFSGSASSEIITTWYAYDDVSDMNVHTFVTVLLPLVGEAAATAATVAAGITAVQNSDGSTTVTVQGSPVIVPAYVPPTQALVFSLSASSLSYTDGAAVSVWPDATGNGNAAVQTNTSWQPTFSTTAMNGHASVVFTSASKQWLLSEQNLFPMGQDYSILALVQLPFHATQYFTGAVSDSHSAGVYGSNLVVMHASQSGGDGFFIGASTINIPTATPVIVAVVFSVISQSVSYYINGTAQGTSTITSFTASNPMPATTIDPTIVIGAQASSQGAFNDHPLLQDFWNGEISELRIYNYQLTPSAIATASTAISVEYGL
jgi:Concanavalin A-like lectin/glucanases superfamily